MMRIKNIEIKVIKGSIAEREADVIVNEANTELTMKEGLAVRICEKGGRVIEEEAMSKGPIGAGEAIVTKAGTLKTKHIIHAVVAEGRLPVEQEIVRSAAANALKQAQELGVRSIIFPALGCGVGEFPLVGSAKIMIQEILKVSKDPKSPLGEISFCLDGDEDFQVFKETAEGYVRHILEDLGPGPYTTVDIIIESPEGVILIERSNPPYGWALPGGFLDYGESLEQAAIREAKEETNLDLANLRQFHTYSELGRDPRFQTISTVFIADGRGTPCSGDDAKDLKIVRYEDLPELEYAFDHKKIIKEYLIEKNLE